jgi:hypothetical protein
MPMPHESSSYGAISAADNRTQIERRQKELAAERQRQIALQSSPLSEPDERIRLWEKLHALRLPKSNAHTLLRVIAEQTNLTLQQVLSVQQHRAASADAPLAPPTP